MGRSARNASAARPEAGGLTPQSASPPAPGPLRHFGPSYPSSAPHPPLPCLSFCCVPHVSPLAPRPPNSQTPGHSGWPATHCWSAAIRQRPRPVASACFQSPAILGLVVHVGKVASSPAHLNSLMQPSGDAVNQAGGTMSFKRKVNTSSNTQISRGSIGDDILSAFPPIGSQAPSFQEYIKFCATTTRLRP